MSEQPDIRRRDTPEARAFWDLVERAKAQVGSHALCFPHMCVVDLTDRCQEQERRQREGRCRSCGEKSGAEAALDALRAQVRPVVEDMRTLAMVAGQASVEEYDLVRAGADAKFAAFATVWADRLAALLDPPSGAPQKNDDDELARVDGQP